MGLKINGIPVAGLGLPGKSAYQAALDGGYQGTEQEFNEFLATMKSSVNADWSQNDETAPDYIKNRTHWVENPTAVHDGSATEEIVHPLDSKFITAITETKIVSLRIASFNKSKRIIPCLSTGMNVTSNPKSSKKKKGL